MVEQLDYGTATGIPGRIYTSPWVWTALTMLLSGTTLAMASGEAPRNVYAARNLTMLSGGIACVCIALDLRRDRRQRIKPIALALICGCAITLSMLVAGPGPACTHRLDRRDFEPPRLREYSQLLKAFKADVGRYPTTEEGLDALLNAPPGVKGWKGPYATWILHDAWGNEYYYRCPGARGKVPYDLGSLGPDGQISDDDIWDDTPAE